MIPILTLAFLSLWWSQEPAPAEVPLVNRSQRQFNFYPGGTVEVSAGLPGNVRVVGWKRASVMVEIEKVVRADVPEKARAIMEALAVGVRYSQTTATIRTSAPPDTPAAVEVHLAIYVPKDKTDMKISLLRGDFHIGALNGWIEAMLGEGSIEAKTLSGYFAATTRRGNLTIELTGSRWEGAALTASTAEGAASLFLPPDYSADLQVETSDGRITVDYPAPVVDGEPVPFQTQPQRKGARLAATLGRGGAPVRIRTDKGDALFSRLRIP